MGKPQSAVTWQKSLCFFLEVLLQRERKPPGTELPDGPFALIQGMSVLATHCNHPKLEASLSYQVLPQPTKPGAAWTSSPVPSPQEVGTYCGVNKCTDLVTVELENSAGPPVLL